MGATTAAVQPPRAGGVGIGVLAADDLLAAGLASLLEARGVRAGRVASLDALHGSDVLPDILVWITDHADGDALRMLWDLRERRELAICLVARTLDLRALRESLRRSADRLAVLAWRDELDFAEVHRALRQLVGGSVVLSPVVLEQLVADSLAEKERLLDRLTAQEMAVLELMATGLRNGAIAERLGRSEKLVEKHVGRIFAKLELDQTVEPDVDRRVRASRIFLLAGPTPEAAGGVPA
jgi:DNA-binding NarL/FixJ family response regulator